jgi:exosome complex protein LRP1
MNYDFGELKNDSNFVNKVQTSAECLKRLEESIQKALLMNKDEMSVDEKVKFELFLVYAVNSLYFMYLKTNGDDITKHGIKDELGRIKEAMQLHQQIKDKTLRPRVNETASKNFVRGALYDFKKKNEEFRRRHTQQQQKAPLKIQIEYNPNAPNRKRKFEDLDD